MNLQAVFLFEYQPRSAQATGDLSFQRMLRPTRPNVWAQKVPGVRTITGLQETCSVLAFAMFVLSFTVPSQNEGMQDQALHISFTSFTSPANGETKGKQGKTQRPPSPTTMATSRLRRSEECNCTVSCETGFEIHGGGPDVRDWSRWASVASRLVH